MTWTVSVKRLECSSVKNLFDNVVGSHCSAYDIFDHFGAIGGSTFSFTILMAVSTTPAP